MGAWQIQSAKIPLARQVDNIRRVFRYLPRKMTPGRKPPPSYGGWALSIWLSSYLAYHFCPGDPASEPAVLAVAKVLPAVADINTGSYDAGSAIRLKTLPRNTSATIGVVPAKFGKHFRALARDSSSIPRAIS